MASCDSDHQDPALTAGAAETTQEAGDSMDAEAAETTQAALSSLSVDEQSDSPSSSRPNFVWQRQGSLWVKVGAPATPDDSSTVVEPQIPEVDTVDVDTAASPSESRFLSDLNPSASVFIPQSYSGSGEMDRSQQVWEQFMPTSDIVFKDGIEEASLSNQNSSATDLGWPEPARTVARDWAEFSSAGVSEQAYYQGPAGAFADVDVFDDFTPSSDAILQPSSTPDVEITVVGYEVNAVTAGVGTKGPGVAAACPYTDVRLKDKVGHGATTWDDENGMGLSTPKHSSESGRGGYRQHWDPAMQASSRQQWEQTKQGDWKHRDWDWQSERWAPASGHTQSRSDEVFARSLSYDKREWSLEIRMQDAGLDDAAIADWSTWAAENVPRFVKENKLILDEDGCIVVRDVNFASNQLGDRGVLELLSALERLRLNVRILKLFKNKIGQAGALALAHWIERSKPVWELHLSHNRIPAEGANALLAAVAGHRGYPPKRSKGWAPLWLRLEHNTIIGVEDLFKRAEQEMWALRSESADLSDAGPMICFVEPPKTGKWTCCSEWCSRSHPRSKWCPLVHVMRMQTQQDGPIDATTWKASPQEAYPNRGYTDAKYAPEAAPPSSCPPPSSFTTCQIMKGIAAMQAPRSPPPPGESSAGGSDSWSAKEHPTDTMLSHKTSPVDDQRSGRRGRVGDRSTPSQPPATKTGEGIWDRALSQAGLLRR
eukprot:gnl/TRDRNA2_/TRDRNA2_65183_c0_seq2.p1 gnl/TRDRNA2_/TRDRNA2_65183_c0~~gnl/TRDRNA2_/TRDRNA2_65183_c0_seq2.p1  ORF type:complete len:712 (-),score=107.46 gnl/TRDRNA2_/TRDRNA2_65183_c0_seq2:162-2297(-)